MRLHYLPPSSGDGDMDMSPSDDASNRSRWSGISGSGVEPILLDREDPKEYLEIYDQDSDFFGSSTPYYVSPLPSPLQQRTSEANDEPAPPRKKVTHFTSTYTAIR